MTTPYQKMLKIDEVAELLGVSQNTVRRWIAAGVIPAPRRFGRRAIRWPASQIAEFIEQQEASRDAAHQEV